jgi:hypothetical protein
MVYRQEACLKASDYQREGQMANIEHANLFRRLTTAN